jgi:uncharacterized membrane protein YqjE
MEEHIHRLKSLLQAIALYAGARGKLLQIEAKEAGVHFSVILAITIVMAGCLICGWLLALPALIWLLAESQGWSWATVALCAAALHLLVGFFLLLNLKARLSRIQIFEETIHQFKRDREWIGDQPNSD